MKTTSTLLALGLSIAVGTALAGPLDPDCTAEKAAKGAVAKSTVGVGGRCSPKEAAADSAKRATGLDGEGKDKAKDLVPSKDKGNS